MDVCCFCWINHRINNWEIRGRTDREIIIAALNGKWKFVSPPVLCIECVRSINRIFNSWTINPCAADLDLGVIYSSFIHPQGTHWHAAFQSLLCTVTSILIKLERWSPQSLSLNWTHPAAWLSIFIQTTQSANKRKIIHTICFMRALFSPFFGKNEIHLKVRASSEAPIFLRCRWWRLSSSLYLL